MNTCEICKTEFHVKPSREKRCHARFCSWKCFKHKLSRACDKCGKNYEIQRWQEIISKYCSKECQSSAKKEQAGYWTGKTRPDLKLPQHWGAGDKHPYWKGGVSRLDKKTRHSYEYIAWRKAVIERDGKVCIMCGEKDNLQVDHILSFRDYPAQRFNVTNGRVLCFGCHRETPSYGFFPKKEGYYA